MSSALGPLFMNRNLDPWLVQSDPDSQEAKVSQTSRLFYPGCKRLMAHYYLGS